MKRFIVTLPLLLVLFQPLAATWWRTKSTNGKYGYMEQADMFKKNSRAWKISPMFEDCALTIDDKGGIAAAKKDGKWGYINTNGHFVIPAIYDDIADTDISSYSYRRGGNLIAACYQGSWGVIDAAGNMVILPLYDKIGFTTTVRRTGIPIVAYKEGTAHYLMDTGEPVLTIGKCEADRPVAFGKGLETMIFPVKKTALWGYVDVAGSTVAAPRWDKPCEWSDNYAIVKENGRYGVIDCEFNYLIPCEYDMVKNKPTSNGRCFIVCRDGRYGALAIDGSVIIPVKSKSEDKITYKRCDKLLSKRTEASKRFMNQLELRKTRLCEKLSRNKMQERDKAAEAEAYYDRASLYADINSAAYWYNRAAWLGNTYAQNKLGAMLYNGSITPAHEYKMAFEWFRKASEAGSPTADWNLGLCYYNGAGTGRDYLKAIEYYALAYAGGADRKSSLESIADCYYSLGTLGGYKKALALYEKTGNDEWTGHCIKNIGTLEKQLEDKRKAFKVVHKKHTVTNQMGTFYNRGIDCLQAKDYAGAYNCFESAANMGMTEAEECISRMYIEGKLAADDFAGELYWYKRLANSTGYPPIFSKIGNIYLENGKYADALEWLLAAAEVDEALALMTLGNYYYSSDKDKAESYYLRAIKQGDVAAEFNLSLLYFDSGRYSEALEWCAKAADHGYDDANLNYTAIAEQSDMLSQHKEQALAYILQQALLENPYNEFVLALVYAKKEFSSNYTAANFWLGRAASAGYADALHRLGNNYYSGNWNTGIDYEKSASLYRQAIAAGCTEAYNSLAWCYYTGNGAEKNNAEALRYTMLGIENGDPDAMLTLAYFYCTGTAVPEKDLGQAGLWLSRARATGKELSYLEHLINNIIESGE